MTACGEHSFLICSFLITRGGHVFIENVGDKQHIAHLGLESSRAFSCLLCHALRMVSSTCSRVLVSSFRLNVAESDHRANHKESRPGGAQNTCLNIDSK